ncbi:MAG: trehalose-phosphatase [Burkholderiales bacterium]
MTIASDLLLAEAPPPALLSRTALFLDFDGTLAPLAPRPQDVEVLDWVVPTLRCLQAALGGAVVLVSGRPLAELDALLHPLCMPAAGVHGVERRGCDGRVRVRSGVPPEDVLQAAQGLVARYPSLLLELKPAALALHYRAAPALGAVCRDTLRHALEGLPGWQLLQGHFVTEVKPQRVSKGAVVASFMAEAPFAGRTPVFVGDDLTDEDGMREALAWGGLGVRVGGGESLAQHCLADPHAVGAWLAASVKALGATSAAVL